MEDRETTGSRPIGIWVGLAANAVAACAGAVFLLSCPGARFCGMELQAQVWVVLTLIATVLGLGIALPASALDLFRQRWLWGALGVVCAFTPIFTAGIVAKLAAALLGLEFD